MENLSIGSIVSQGFKIGFKNMASLIGAVFLWLITIWIPYLNVGTTIGLLSIVVAMSKGSIISPTEIFDSKYRQYMGEFFLLVGLVYVGVVIGLMFFIIPGLVISIAWGQAIYLLIDKEINPMEALKVSNQMTHGKKWTLFFGMLILGIILYAILAIFGAIGYLLSEDLASIISLIGLVIFYPVILGAHAHIYEELLKRIDKPAA